MFQIVKFFALACTHPIFNFIADKSNTVERSCLYRQCTSMTAHKGATFIKVGFG